MILTKEKGLRMWGGGFGSSAGGGGGGSAAGSATQEWVDGNYVSQPFFNEIFTIHGTETVEVTDGTSGTTTTTTTDIVFQPNELPSTTTETDSTTGDVTVTTREITSVEVNYGVWTDYFMSALGLNNSGGGGGATLNQPLSSINTSGLSAPGPSQNGQTVVWNNTTQKWEYGNAGGGGSGTVTSVGMSVPTGFVISNSPITTSGTLALTFASNYALPLTADVEKGVTAYGMAHTHTNKTVLDNISSGDVSAWSSVANMILSTSIHANDVLASPNGSTGAGSFRALVAADIPDLSGTYATPSSVSTQMQNYAYISSGVIYIGNSSITPLTSHQTVSGTFWGNSWSNGGSLSSDIYINNNAAIRFYDSTNYPINVLTFNTSNLCALGYGVMTTSTDSTRRKTLLQGGTMEFEVGYKSGSTEYKTVALKIAKETINGDDVDGIVNVTQGLRIGDGLITWDSTNNALKVTKNDGTAANFYSLGGVSALGFSTGSSGTDSATITTLTTSSISNGSGNVKMGNICSSAPSSGTANWTILTNGTATFKQITVTKTSQTDTGELSAVQVKSPKFYFDDYNHYLFVSSNKLYFYNGTTNKEIAFV